jgi:uncharacterized membrane protein
MLRSAVRGAAGAKMAAVAAFTAFALGACGGKPEADGAAGAANVAVANSGPVNPGAATRGPDATAQAASAAAALDTSGWQLAPPFYAGGEEPSWRLDIVDGWFVFKRSGLPEIEAPMVQPTKAGGSDVFDSPPLKISIKREACQTDEGGHGDASAVVAFDGNDFDGCAFSGQSTATSPEASTVAESVALIDACLGKLGEPALVTAVYPREGGRTGVGLRSKDGSLYECAVEPDGREIAYLDPIEPRDVKSWMSKMRFLRAGVSDATKCPDAEEVKAENKVLGRLLTPKCKF